MHRIETPSQSADQQPRPSRRWFLLVLLCAITVINLVDRQAVSVLAPMLRQMFHLTNIGYGRIVAAFQFGMMTGELPMGWLMDRWGCRIGLFTAVCCWSAATGNLAYIRSGSQLGVNFFFMGGAQCGNFSGGIKALFQIFGRAERTLAIGIFNSGSVIGPMIAPPLLVFLAVRYGYRAAILLPAAAGLGMAALWWYFYRTPEDARSGLAPSIPLRALLGQSSSWAVMLCRFFVGPVIQFYWYWLPSYLFATAHLSLLRVGALAWIPFFLGGGGSIAGGCTASWLYRRGVSTYNIRRLTMYSSSLLCLASLLVPLLPTISLTLTAISIAIFGHNFLSANMYGAITDLFPESAAARATALTGLAAGVSGFLFPLLTGFLVDRVSYAPVFLLAGFMPLAGTIALFTLGRKSNFYQAAA